MLLQSLGPHWWIADIIIFLAAVLLATAFTPLCKKIAGWVGLMDRPAAEAHKGHKKATPLLGGLALFCAWSITIFGGILFSRILTQEWVGSELANAFSGMTDTKVLQNMYVIVGCGALAMILGLLDDWKALNALHKLLGQIAIAAIAVWGGGMHISLFIHVPLINDLITIFWFVLIFNAINFFDNMDGLAVGTACIGMGIFTMAAIITGQYYVAALAAAGAGATLGFWFFNHTPASIFMGDSGSHFLAYLLAMISVKITYLSSDSATYLAPLIPIFVLALPLYDVLAVIIIRKRNGKPIYKGDHNHVSHRFAAMGMSRKMAVLSVHLLSLIIGLGVLPLIWGDKLTSLVLLAQGILILILVSLLQYTARNAGEV